MARGRLFALIKNKAHKALKAGIDKREVFKQ